MSLRMSKEQVLMLVPFLIELKKMIKYKKRKMLKMKAPK